MFDHIMIGTNDIEKSKAFYEKVLKVIGVEGAMDNTLDSGIKRVFFMHGGNVLALSQPIDGEPATCANGMTTCAISAISTDTRSAACTAPGDRRTGGCTVESPSSPACASERALISA